MEQGLAWGSARHWAWRGAAWSRAPRGAGPGLGLGLALGLVERRAAGCRSVNHGPFPCRRREARSGPHEPRSAMQDGCEWFISPGRDPAAVAPPRLWPRSPSQPARAPGAKGPVGHLPLWTTAVAVGDGYPFMGLWAALGCKPPPCHHHPGSCRARSARPPQPHPRSLLPRGHPSMCHCPFRSVTGGRHHQGARTRCSEKCPHSWGSSGGFAGTGGVGLTLKQRRLLGKFYLWCPMSFHGGVAGERKHLKVQSLFLIAALVSASRRVHHQLSSYSCPGCVARRRSLLHGELAGRRDVMAVLIPAVCLFWASRGHFRGQHCHFHSPKQAWVSYRTSASHTELGEVNKSLPKLISVVPSRDLLYHSWETTASAPSRAAPAAPGARGGDEQGKIFLCLLSRGIVCLYHGPVVTGVL